MSFNMLYKILIPLSLFFLLTGCAKQLNPNLIGDIPTLNIPSDPEEPVKKLTPESKPDEVIKAWVATATAYKNWNRVIRNQIKNSGL